jgi:hypothetical protein
MLDSNDGFEISVMTIDDIRKEKTVKPFGKKDVASRLMLCLMVCLFIWLSESMLSAQSYWPQTPKWAKDAMKPPTNRPKEEPPQGNPPPNARAYYMICKERAHLYWFTVDGRFGRLTSQEVFRSPVAMCKGPDNTLWVMDLPKWRTDPTILWEIRPDGTAQAIDQWRRESYDPGVPIQWPTQMAYRNGYLFISDEWFGLVVRHPDRRLQIVVNPLMPPTHSKAEMMAKSMNTEHGTSDPKRYTKKFGGIAFHPSGAVLFGQGFYHRIRVNPMHPQQSMPSTTEPGGVLAADFNQRQIRFIASDEKEALWKPRAMLLTQQGEIYITDEGQPDRQRKNPHTGAGKKPWMPPGSGQLPSLVTETDVGEIGSLQKVVGNQVTRVAVRIGNRSLRRPWGLSMDYDGSILICDPAMWDEQGNSGAVVRFSPNLGASYLFLGRGKYNPLGVLTR